MKPNSPPWRAKPKTYRQAPTHWLKFYEEAVWGPNRRRAIKEWSIAIKPLPVSILQKSVAGCYRPVRVADETITALPAVDL